MTTNIDREKFEAWLQANGGDVSTHADGTYWYASTDLDWAIWQAALQSQQADCGCADQRDCTGECCKQAAAEPVKGSMTDKEIADINKHLARDIADAAFGTPPEAA